MAEKVGLIAVLDMSQFNKNFLSYTRAINKMNVDTKLVSGSLSSSFGKLAGVVSKTLVAGILAAGAAITAFAVGGIKAAIQMEDKMAGIAAIMNKTKKEVEPLSKLILDLSVNPKLKVTATEAADAVELLARNGLSMTEILDGAAEATVLLANATGTNFGNAANIATDAMAIFNIKASNMIEAVNGIVSVATNSKFSIDDYAFALASAGGVASAVGVEFEDFNVGLAAITPLFKSGRDAGTSYKTFLQRLAPTTDKQIDALARLGIVTEDGSNQFFTASGRLKDMAEISSILNGALSGLSEQQKNMALSTIFGSDAMRAAVGIADSGVVVYKDAASAAKALGVSVEEIGDAAKDGVTEYEALMIQMRQTDALQSAATRMDTVAGTLEIIKSLIQGTALQVGNAFLPLIRSIADAMLDFADRSGPKVIAFFESVATVLSTFIDGLVEGETPINSFFDGLSKAGIPKETIQNIEKLADSAKVLGEVLINLGTSFLVFKGLLQVQSTVTGVTAAITKAGVTFASAGGGLSGFVALLGGPLVVAAALAAVAIVGLVRAVRDYNQRIDEGQNAVENQIDQLAEASRTTGDYREEAAKLANALEIASTGVGQLTGASKQIRDQMVDVIIATGDFSGSNEDLEASLQAVFGETLRVSDQMITLNDRVIAETRDVRGLGEAHQYATEQFNAHTAAYEIGNNVLQQQILAKQAERQAHVEAVQQYAIGNEALRQQILGQQGLTDTTTTGVELTRTLTDELKREANARQQIITLSEYEIARRQEVASIISEASTQQADSIRTIIQAQTELDVLQQNAANVGWSQGMIEQANEAEASIQESFAAIAESHRLMVQEIFIQNANLEGGFNESAANVAVALGLMTQKEAELKLESQQTTDQIGAVGDALTQAFLDDGYVSRQEADLLSQAITGIEEGAFTADEALRAFSTGGLQALIEDGTQAKSSTKNVGDEFKKLPADVQTGVNDAKERILSADWIGTGKTIPQGVRDGITSQNKLPANAAAVVADETDNEFNKHDWEGIGASISQGIANGISSNSGAVSSAAAAAVADAVASARAAGDIASPSKLTEELIGLPFVQGIAKGIDANVYIIGESVKLIVDTIIATAETQQERLKGLFDLAGSFSSLGSSFASRFTDVTISPLEMQADQLEARVKKLQGLISNSIDNKDFFNGGGTYVELIRLSKGELGAPPETVRRAAELLRIYSEQSDINKQIRQEQEKILQLQQAQQDLAFLEQQTKLLDLISEHGLNAGDILQGLELGINADAGGLVEAMTRAIQAIVAAAEGELQIASPSKVFENIGKFTLQGFGKGILEQSKNTMNSMRDVTRGIINSVTGGGSSITNNNQQNRSFTFDINNSFASQPQVTDRSQLELLLASFV